MSEQKYRNAYEAFQQAVYRDGRNPSFWCSIGVLYFQLGQHRDALDAYSRAIRLNPYISEVWFDLGTLYEACHQFTDALDAYMRAGELDPSNEQIQQRITALRVRVANGGVAPQGQPPIGKDDLMQPRVSGVASLRSGGYDCYCSNRTYSCVFIDRWVHLMD